MPQLIAMVIVVVAAMIYMFQTFGGTGDKIEGIAQKTSVVTEINNIKNGLKLAARAQHIEATADANTEAVTNLQGLAALAYFPEQVNEQLTTTGNTNVNVYNAISFGGSQGVANVLGTTNTSAMKIALVSNRAGFVPGIYVDLADGSLAANAGFLEAQIATDLASVAEIDRNATGPTAAAGAFGTTGIDTRIPAQTTGTAITAGQDGKFIIYFRDFATNEVVQ